MHISVPDHKKDYAGTPIVFFYIIWRKWAFYAVLCFVNVFSKIMLQWGSQYKRATGNHIITSGAVVTFTANTKDSENSDVKEWAVLDICTTHGCKDVLWAGQKDHEFFLFFFLLSLKWCATLFFYLHQYIPRLLITNSFSANEVTNMEDSTGLLGTFPTEVQ